MNTFVYNHKEGGKGKHIPFSEADQGDYDARQPTVEAIKADALSGDIKKIDQACRTHIDKSSHWTAGPMIWDKAVKGKPKSKAIQDWTEGCWTQYFTNKAMLTGGAPFNETMLVYPVCPYDIGEAWQE